MEALEQHERTEMAHHSAHGSGHNAAATKRIAILIMVVAALLAITEMGGKNAQNDYLSSNIEAANLWSFFQAKTIRQTVLKTAAEDMETRPKQAEDIQLAIDKKVEKFYATVERYEDEPATGEGRKQLVSRAKDKEAIRDRALAAYHLFEYGSAAFQLAIVLASAAVITGLVYLAFVSIGLASIGIAFGMLGMFVPTLVHL